MDREEILKQCCTKECKRNNKACHKVILYCIFLILNDWLSSIGSQLELYLNLLLPYLTKTKTYLLTSLSQRYINTIVKNKIKMPSVN